MRWVLWLLRAPVDFAIHWNLAWLRVADAVLEWPDAVCNELEQRALELEEDDDAGREVQRLHEL